MKLYRSPWKFAVLGVVAAMCAALPAVAQTPHKAPDPPKVTEPKQPEPPKKDSSVEEYEKAIKDLKKYEGALTLYTRKKEILLELPAASLGKLLMVQAAFNTGATSDGVQAGFPIGDQAIDVYRVERHEDQVWFVRPNVSYRWGKANDLAEATERSFPEAILAGYKIENENPEKKLILVNVTNLFNGELFRLNELISAGVGGQYMLDREKSRIDQVKNFPENTNVRMFLHYTNPRPQGDGGLGKLLGLGPTNQLEDSRSCPIKVTFNLWWRAQSSYMPRQADPRIGYFTADYFDVGKFFVRDRTERYINRFNLVKKDPKAAVSEPVKPIVWYIDNSVPMKWRPAVKRGILFWNKAFDALGYKDAVQVREAPENDPNWDHADGRFNVVRFAMSESDAYAIALFRTDPFTGEILNASVNLDANMLSFTALEHENLTVPASNTYDLARQTIFGDITTSQLATKQLTGDYDPNVASFQALAKKAGFQTGICDYPRAKAAEAGFSYYAALAGGTMIKRDEYVSQFLSDVISHEIGHCMGLRHNFIGSTIHTAGDLADDAKVETEGLSASVMDYVPANIEAVLRGKGYYYTPTIGQYDVHAIKYGYMDVKATTPEGERNALAKVAAESGIRGNAYMTDEDADSFNPLVIRFDNSADPIENAARDLQAARRVRLYAIKSLPRPGESYAVRNQLILGSLNKLLRSGGQMATFVGGVVGNRQYKGDIGERPNLAPVAPETQRKAMQLISRECLSVSAIDVPESVLFSMGQNYDTGTSNGWIAPLRSTINRIQVSLFAMLMSADRINRICENEFKWRSNPKGYTLHEHVGLVTGAVFSDARSGKPIAATRRDLQAFAVESLIGLAGKPAGQSNDARTIANQTLKSLQVDFEKSLKSQALDATSRAHLSEMRDKIARFMARQLVGA